jgi:hypothetical protein
MPKGCGWRSMAAPSTTCIGTNLIKSPTVYQIRVKGYLGEEWSDWFDGMAVTHPDNGETILTGPIVDQPALFGMLFKVSNLNITLLSVNVVSFDQKS